MKTDDKAAAAAQAAAESAQIPALGWRRRTAHLAAASAKFAKVPDVVSSLSITADVPLAEYQRPMRIDSFSLDANGQLHLDDRGMRTYVEPPLGADLSYGIDKAVVKELENDHPDSLLWVLKAKDHGSKAGRADLIIFRGTLMRLCLAGFAAPDGGAQNAVEPWKMNVMLVGETLYVEDHASPESIREKAAVQAQQFKHSYPGYSFEQYCTTSSSDVVNPQDPPGWSGDVNTSEQWLEVVATRLGEHRIIVGGETDCVNQRGEGVELKVAMAVFEERGEMRFERRMLKYFLQSYLIGNKYCVVGFRNKEDELVAFEEYDVLEMPSFAVGKPHAWDPQIGLNFAASIISWLRKTLTEEQAKENESKASEPRVWRLELQSPFDKLTLRPISEHELRAEVQEGKDEGRVGFLMRDYFDWAVENARLHSSAS